MFESGVEMGLALIKVSLFVARVKLIAFELLRDTPLVWDRKTDVEMGLAWIKLSHLLPE